MPLTSAERQRAWRDRHRGEPQGNKALMAQLAALQGRVDQLEVELSTMPSAEPRAPTERLLEAYTALRQKRDELAVLLVQIEAYQPGTTAKAKAWIAQIDAPPRRRR
jgi:hypothetical protein